MDIQGEIQQKIANSIGQLAEQLNEISQKLQQQYIPASQHDSIFREIRKIEVAIDKLLLEFAQSFKQ